jgi:hypothetical protein
MASCRGGERGAVAVDLAANRVDDLAPRFDATPAAGAGRRGGVVVVTLVVVRVACGRCCQTQ